MNLENFAILHFLYQAGEYEIAMASGFSFSFANDEDDEDVPMAGPDEANINASAFAGTDPVDLTPLRVYSFNDLVSE